MDEVTTAFHLILSFTIYRETFRNAQSYSPVFDVVDPASSQSPSASLSIMFMLSALAIWLKNRGLPCCTVCCGVFDRFIVSL